MTIVHKAPLSACIYRFDQFRLDPLRRVLLDASGAEVHLSAKSFDALVYLVEHAGELVSKNALREALWPTTVVDDNNLYVAISHLRHELRDANDEGAAPPISTITGRGYQFTAAVKIEEPDPADSTAPVAGATQPTTRRQGPWLRLALIGVLVVAALAISSTLLDPTLPEQATASDSGQDSAPVWTPEVSIGVLPLKNLTGDVANDYIGEGISDEIITQLNTIDSLRVPPRTTAFALDTDSMSLADVASRLGVEFIVEGTVRMVDARIRVNLKLINAASGAYLWSETYDREFSDLIDLQDKLSAVVVLALTRDRMVLFMDGAERLYRAVLSRDPDFLPARIGLAVTYANSAFERPDLLAHAEREAIGVLALDPDNSTAHIVLGKVLFFRGDYEGSERAFTAALDAGSDYEFARSEYARMLISVGRIRLATALLEQVHAQVASSSYVLGYLADSYAKLGMLEIARQFASEAERLEVPKLFYPIAASLLDAEGSPGAAAMLDATVFFPHTQTDSSFARIGYQVAAAMTNPSQRPGVLTSLDNLLAAPGKLDSYSLEYACHSLVYLVTQIGEIDAAYRLADYCISNAVGKVPSGVALWHLWGVNMAAFRADPRFEALATRLGMHDYWRMAAPPDACELTDAQLSCNESPAASADQARRGNRAAAIEQSWFSVTH